MRWYPVLPFALILLATAAPIDAQQPGRQALELSAGYAGFLDEDPVDHFIVGGAWRWQITRRLALAPEIVFMRGPASDRDLFLTGRLTLDAVPEGKLSPYLVADGGVMFHRDVLRLGPYWSKEGAVSIGGGFRVQLSRTLYVAPEVRLGWEPHLRVVGLVGWRLGE